MSTLYVLSHFRKELIYMRKISALLSCVAVFVIMLMSCSPANAALQAVGPPDLLSGMPVWYQDNSGVALAQCLDQNGFCPFAGTPFATNPPAIATVPPISALNFPVEVFYHNATATLSVGSGAKAVLTLPLEGTTLGAVALGQYFTFIRVDMKRIVAGLTPNSTYKITHPYGTFTVSTNAVGGIPAVNGQAFRSQDGCAAAPCDFTLLLPATVTGMGPFLSSIAGPLRDPVTGNTYIGDSVTPVTITGSPLGTNVFQIDGPNIGGAGVNTISTNQFVLTGKLYGMMLTPNSNDYGGVIVAATTPPPPVKAFTVTNVNTFNVPAGAGNITIGSVALTGPNAADFIINPAGTDTCVAGKLLVASTPATPTTCTISASFVPKPLAPAPEVAVRTATLQIIPSTVGAPTAQVALSGTAQYTMTAGADVNGAILPTGAAIIVNAGATQNFTVQPKPKFQVRDITVNGVASTFTQPAKLTDPVVFTAPPATANGTTVNATFMPSGDLNADGTLATDDALKALKIFAGILLPEGDDLVAMKVSPLDATGRPNGTGTPDLSDVVLILRRAVGIISW
jgi:hypothetical protein